MSDEASTITLETLRRALTRAALPLAGFCAAGFVAALFDRLALAASLVSLGAALALAAATTALVEGPLLTTARAARTLAPRDVGARTAVAAVAGAVLGALLVLQLTFVDGLSTTGSVQGGLSRFAVNGAQLALFVVLGVVCFAVPLGLVSHHRLTLDASDRLDGTPGPIDRVLVRSFLLAAPLCFSAWVAPLVAWLLFRACQFDEWIARRLARRSAGGDARALKRRLAQGSVSREHLELAAYAGHPGASEIGLTPFVPPGLTAWAEGLRVFGVEVCVRAATAGLSVAVPAHERVHGGDLARSAWRALDAWLARPDAETLATARAAADAITPADAPAARAARAAASAASRAGPFATTAAARDAATSLAASGEATGDDGVVRAAACQTLQAWAVSDDTTRRSIDASTSGSTSGSANG